MPTISINITGSQQTREKLDKLGLGLMNFTEAMREIGTNFIDYYRDRPFLTRGTIFDNANWPALKASTMREKAKKYPTYASYPLIRTGQMRNSFAFQSSSNAMVLGNEARYFDFHQLGTSHIPQRLMLALNSETNKTIKQIIENDIRRKIEAL